MNNPVERSIYLALLRERKRIVGPAMESDRAFKDGRAIANEFAELQQ